MPPKNHPKNLGWHVMPPKTTVENTLVTVHIGGVFPRAQRAEKNFGVLPQAKRAEKKFKVYLRERSERKILCWDCPRQVFLHILDGFYLKRVYKGTLLVVNGACFGDWPI